GSVRSPGSGLALSWRTGPGRARRTTPSRQPGQACGWKPREAEIAGGPAAGTAQRLPRGWGRPGGGAAGPTPAVRLSLQMLRLHLPDPPADSEEEEAAAEGAAAQSSRSSIPMDAEHVELVKRTMASVKLPTLGIPAWASQISEDQWKDVVQRTLQARQSLSGPRPEWK
uniref:Male-enhanced antigen 1 n=1 Tax=Athene cunicularia TaxID=194338 RepID=A0A663MW84_ATHCN